MTHDLPLARQRQQQIYQQVRESSGCTTRALAQRFGTSTMTIRRDLETLERQGLLQRVHGGAVLRSDVPSNHVLLSDEQPYLTRDEKAAAQKRAIGAAAARLVEPGMTVYLDSGTTAMAVARALHAQAARHSFTVVTHALNVACLFALPRTQRVIMIGGEVLENTAGTASATALRQLRELNYDLFFMGTCGVDPVAGLTNTNVPEAELKQAVHERSARTVLIADRHKWPVRALAPVLPLSAVQGWISDAGLPQNAQQHAAAHHVPVSLAQEVFL